MLEILKKREKILVGLISDTHGLMRPEIPVVFKDVDLIVHAGDMDGPEVLDALNNIAPTISVRGNMDRGTWCRDIPEIEVIDLKHLMLYVLHDIGKLDLSPAEAGFAAVISGHTHKPSLKEIGGVLFVNPGSAGPRRFDYPISVGMLQVNGKELDTRFITF